MKIIYFFQALKNSNKIFRAQVWKILFDTDYSLVVNCTQKSSK